VGKGGIVICNRGELRRGEEKVRVLCFCLYPLVAHLSDKYVVCNRIILCIEQACVQRCLFTVGVT
jgi:hypothetical protein